MSVLARKKIGNIKYKARIYIRSSRKATCIRCGKRDFGVLTRFIEPKKVDSILCHNCVLGMAAADKFPKILSIPQEISLEPKNETFTEKETEPDPEAGTEEFQAVTSHSVAENKPEAKPAAKPKKKTKKKKRKKRSLKSKL